MSRVQKDPAYAVQVTGNVATGQTFYTKSGCDTCHGPLGRGTAAGPSIAGTSRTLPDFIAYERKPAGTMPARNAQAIPDQALTDIYLFLRAATPLTVGRVQKDPANEATPAGRAANGATLYKKVGCYQCHADEAQGGLAGPRIGPDPIPFARFAQYVRNPAGEMPPYTDKVVSSQDLADIYAFLQARPRPPAVNAIPQLAP
jgi:mono/diheme cytochrome c family protein